MAWRPQNGSYSHFFWCACAHLSRDMYSRHVHRGHSGRWMICFLESVRRCAPGTSTQSLLFCVCFGRWCCCFAVHAAWYCAMRMATTVTHDMTMTPTPIYDVRTKHLDVTNLSSLFLLTNLGRPAFPQSCVSEPTTSTFSGTHPKSPTLTCVNSHETSSMRSCQTTT